MSEIVVMYEGLRRIRDFEEEVIALFNSGKVPGFSHSYIGQEATAVGVCHALEPDDRVASNHRGHGHVLAKGADPSRMMAEILGKQTGYLQGMGGELHIMDADIGVLGANGIVGANFPIAAGAALNDKLAGNGRVTVAFLGDGSTAEGTFSEALNIAALWELPVVFVCENNRYGEWTPVEDAVAGRIVDRGTSFGIPGVEVDGQDVVAVHEVAQEAVDRARSGNGSTLIESHTYRWHGHMYGEEAMLGGKTYRPPEEIEHWRNNRDPVVLARQRCIDEGAASEQELAALEERIRLEIATAAKFAQESAVPAPEQALEFVFESPVAGPAESFSRSA
jgi:acetoin:2,6-dichlorophenolindophenol oxidoreductase subunit alpha